ncbi:MAG: ParA family protein [Planctomycetota bacterium]
MLVTITNQKGGVGKTMLTVHLAVWLAEQGVPTVVLDADNQGLTAEWLEKAAPDLPVLHSADADQLSTVLDRIDPGYTVLADAPPGLGEGSLTLLRRCDRAIIPLRPSFGDMRATVQTLRTLDKLAGEKGGGGGSGGGGSGADRFDATLVVNMMRPGANHTKLAVATLPQYGFPVATQTIGHRTAYENASAEGTVVWKLAGDTKATNEMKTLCAELAASFVPANEIKTSPVAKAA